MTFEEIRQAIETHMASWADHPIAWDGVPAGPDVLQAQGSGSPWVRATIVDGDSFTSSIGSGPCVRRTGIIMVQVFTPLDKGSAPARSIASSIAEHIEYWQQGQLETHAASLVRVGPQDGYYQVNVTCGFRAG